MMRCYYPVAGRNDEWRWVVVRRGKPPHPLAEVSVIRRGNRRVHCKKTYHALCHVSSKCLHVWYGSTVHHLTSLETQKYIFKVCGPKWRTLTSSRAAGAFSSKSNVCRKFKAIYNLECMGSIKLSTILCSGKERCVNCAKKILAFQILFCFFIVNFWKTFLVVYRTVLPTAPRNHFRERPHTAT
jgi:hypothetical protein